MKKRLAVALPFLLLLASAIHAEVIETPEGTVDPRPADLDRRADPEGSGGAVPGDVSGPEGTRRAGRHADAAWVRYSLR